MPLLPLSTDLFVDPLAGDDRKNKGDEVRLFCDVSCDVRFILGVSCDRACCDAWDASERNWSSGPYSLGGLLRGGSELRCDIV